MASQSAASQNAPIRMLPLICPLSWLLQVICWVVGEYGRLSGHSEESVMDMLAAIPETQTSDDEVR